jgi:hypothetical protein
VVQCHRFVAQTTLGTSHKIQPLSFATHFSTRRDRLFNTVTTLWAGRMGNIGSISESRKIFLMPRQALASTKHPIQWLVIRDICLGICGQSVKPPIHIQLMSKLRMSGAVRLPPPQHAFKVCTGKLFTFHF